MSCDFEIAQLDQAIRLLQQLMTALQQERAGGQPVRRSVRVRSAMREAQAWLEGEDAHPVPR